MAEVLSVGLEDPTVKSLFAYSLNCRLPIGGGVYTAEDCGTAMVCLLEE